MHYCLSSIILLCLPLFSYSASAASESDLAAPPTEIALPMADPFSADALVQLLLGLLAVIALILLLAWIAKRALGVPQSGRYMRVLTGLPLGAREKIVLVQVGKEQLLLGVAPGRVSLLTRLEEPVGEPDKPDASFGQRILEAMQKRQGS